MTFRVIFPERPDIWRRIQLHVEQTLADLHAAILQAFDWENDHLYAFFLSGKAWDSLTEYSLPEEAFLGSPNEWPLDDEATAPSDVAVDAESDPLAPFAGVSDSELEALIAEAAEIMGISITEVRALLDEPVEDYIEDRDVRNVQLGTLGIEPGHTMLYLYDFDRELQFPVQLEARSSASDSSPLPRLIESIGKAPGQYALWDDNDPQDAPLLASNDLPVAS